MFTGIVEEMGTILQVSGGEGGKTFSIEAKVSLEDTSIGDSISVSGVCLTVTKLTKRTFSVDVAPETLAKTNLGLLAVHGSVNLERALTPTSRMGGHSVQGHVDDVAVLEKVEPEGEALHYWFRCSKVWLPYIVPKGFICLDGVSLTVIETTSDGFDLMLIPHTQKSVTLGNAKAGYRANLEVDIMAKYIDKLLAQRFGSSSVS